MQLYCPSCQAPATAADRCPRCGDRLVTPAEAFSANAELLPPPPELIRPTPMSRAIVGCVIALGTYLGLNDVLGAILATMDPFPDTFAQLMTVLLRLGSVSIGAMLAGAGRPRGMSNGLVVGLISVALFAFADSAQGQHLGGVAIGVGLAITCLAALGGYIGSRVWPQAIEIPDPATPIIRGSSLSRLAKEDTHRTQSRPTIWWKIVLGVFLIVGGISTADTVRSNLRRASGGLLNFGGAAQAPIVDLQLATVAILLGGVIAGGSTGAGLRHGFFTGIFSASALAAMLGSGMTAPEPVFEGILRFLGYSNTSPPFEFGELISALGVIFVGGTVGGWLGGQILPPLAPAWMRTRLIPLD